MRKWMMVLGMALAASGCSSNPEHAGAGSNANAAMTGQGVPADDGTPHQDPARLVKPVYPGFDALFGVTGTTIVRLTIAPDGHVLTALVERSSGHPELDDSAVTAVRQSFFFPARRNGSPVLSAARVPINFAANYLKHGGWPADYLNPHYILDSQTFPYHSVMAAYEGLSELAHGSSTADGRVTTFRIYNKDKTVREEWAFTDLGLSSQMAIRFVFSGAPKAPEVAVSALCEEGTAACEGKTAWFLMGPSYARGVQP